MGARWNMNAVMFLIRVRRWPRQDDLERVNRLKAGAIGHRKCGWCYKCRCPRFECSCYPIIVSEASKSDE